MNAWLERKLFQLVYFELLCLSQCQMADTHFVNAMILGVKNAHRSGVSTKHVASLAAGQLMKGVCMC